MALFARSSPAILLVAPLLLAGCAMFAPRYDAALETNVVAADQEIQTVAAKVDLGVYAKPDSFGGTTDTYADAIAKLQVASAQAANLIVQSKLATRERTNLSAIIDGCTAQVKTVAKIHQASGLAANAGLTGAMVVACSEAVRAVQAQKK